MSATYTPIQTVDIASTTSTILFSNIPQDYTDLVLRMSILSTGSGSVRVIFNNDNNSNYTQIVVYQGNAGSATSNFDSGVAYFTNDYFTPSTTKFCTTLLEINSYSSRTLRKTILEQSGDASVGHGYSVGTWRRNPVEPITSIRLEKSAGSFAAGSVATLYGIKAGSPKAIGGDIVVQSGGYWYHAFLSSGSFEPQMSSLSCDVLVVGGGGGATTAGGGGGAGGVTATTSATITAKTTVTVGAGGFRAGSSASPSSGNNSSFGSLLTGYAGGPGGAVNQAAGSGTWGSGGGGGYDNAGATRTGASGTAGQGNTGGNGIANNNGGGGGGGAGAAGNNSSSGGVGGAGGAGTNTYSTWLTATGLGVSGFIAGGGGGAGGSPGTGGSGGSGGGGAGTAAGGGNGTSGTANTGSGGGSAHNGANLCGGGGSGLVIVRYAA